MLFVGELAPGANSAMLSVATTYSVPLRVTVRQFAKKLFGARGSGYG
jgi:hypothetical protein